MTEREPSGVERVSVHGMQFARLSAEETVAHVFRCLERGQGGWLLTAHLDYLRLHARNPELRALWDQADLVVADGMPILWASRLQGTRLPERVAGSDLVWSLAEAAATAGRSLYLLGGDPGAAEGASQELRRRWPSLRIVGSESPRFSAPPSEAELTPVREALATARPDLVYVALGVPKQDHVIRALRPVLPAAWFVGVGVSLSFMAGQVHRAPAWMQKSGLEWLHRMAQEPGRLARRYLVDDLPFAFRLLAEARRERQAR